MALSLGRKVLVLALVLHTVACVDKLWNTGDGKWSDGPNWNPTGVPSGSDFAKITKSGTYVVTLDSPGGANIDVLLGNGGTSLTMSTGTSTFDDFTGASGTTFVGTNKLTVSTLQLTGGTLSVATGGTFTSQTSFLLNGGSIQGGGTFSLTGTSATISSAWDASGSIFCTTSSPLSVGADFQVNTLSANQVTVASGGTLTVKNGGTYSIGTGPGTNTLIIGGAMVLKGTVSGTGTSKMTLNSGGTLSFDNSANSISVKATTVNWQAPVTINCATTNPITLDSASTFTPNALTAQGAAGCNVNLPFATITQPLIVNSVTVVDNTPGDGITMDVAGQVTVTNGGVLRTNSLNSALTRTITIQDTAKVQHSNPANPVVINLSDSGGSSVLQITSSSAHYFSIGKKYAMNLNNPAAQITVTSGSTVPTGDWNLDACTKVNFEKDIRAQGTFNIKSCTVECPDGGTGGDEVPSGGQMVLQHASAKLVLPSGGSRSFDVASDGVLSCTAAGGYLDIQRRLNVVGSFQPGACTVDLTDANGFLDISAASSLGAFSGTVNIQNGDITLKDNSVVTLSGSGYWNVQSGSGINNYGTGVDFVLSNSAKFEFYDSNPPTSQTLTFTLSDTSSWLLSPSSTSTWNFAKDGNGLFLNSATSSAKVAGSACVALGNSADTTISGSFLSTATCSSGPVFLVDSTDSLFKVSGSSANAEWQTGQFLFSSGTAQVLSGGKLKFTNQGSYRQYKSSGGGALSISGSGSAMELSGTGGFSAESGTIRLATGGVLSLANSGTSQVTADCDVEITGSGSSLNIGNTLTYRSNLGGNGAEPGCLLASSGGSISVASGGVLSLIDSGAFDNDDGCIVVDSSSSKISVSGSLRMLDSSFLKLSNGGSMSIATGGSVSLRDNSRIQDVSSSSSKIVLDGSLSYGTANLTPWNINTNLVSGSGTLTIENGFGGAIQVQSSGIISLSGPGCGITVKNPSRWSISDGEVHVENGGLFYINDSFGESHDGKDKLYFSGSELKSDGEYYFEDEVDVHFLQYSTGKISVRNDRDYIWEDKAKLEIANLGTIVDVVGDNCAGNDLDFEDDSELRLIDGATMTVSKVDINIRDKSKFTMDNGATLTLTSCSNVIIDDSKESPEMDATDSTINLGTSTLTIGGKGKADFDGVTFTGTVGSGSITLEDCSDVSFTDVQGVDPASPLLVMSQDKCGKVSWSGKYTATNNATFTACQTFTNPNSGYTINSVTIIVDDGCLTFTNSAYLKIVSNSGVGQLKVVGEGIVSSYDIGLFTFDPNTFFFIEESGTYDVRDNSVVVWSGNVIADASGLHPTGANFFVGTASTLISTGQVDLLGSTYGKVEDSTVTVNGGKWTLSENSDLDISGTSTFTVQSGSLLVSSAMSVEDSSTLLAQSTLTVDDGRLDIINGGTLDNSGLLTVSGTGILNANAGTIYLKTTDVSVIETGRIEVQNSGILQLDSGGKLTLDATSTLQSFSPSTINLGNKNLIAKSASNIIVAGLFDFSSANSLLELKDTSKMTVSAGGILSQDTGKTTLTSTAEIDIYGSYTISTSSLIADVSSKVYSFGPSGNILIGGSAIVSFSDSSRLEANAGTISVSGSPVTFNDDSTLAALSSGVVNILNSVTMLQTSDVNVNSGTVSLSGSLALQSSATLDIANGGIVSMGSGSSSLQFTNSTSGTLSSSSLTMSAGSFSMAGTTSLTVSSSSNLSYLGGTATLVGNSVIDILSGTITIANTFSQDGSATVSATGSSSSVLVQAGALLGLKTSSSIDIDNAATFSSSGSVLLEDLSVLSLNNAIGSVIGGTFDAQDQSSIDISSGGAFSILSPVSLWDLASIDVSSGTLYSTNNLALHQQSGVLLDGANALMTINGGQTVFYDSSSLDMDASNLDILFGSVLMQGSSILTMTTGSTIDIQSPAVGDTFTIAGSAGSLTSSFINVDDGRLVISGGVLVSVSTSSIIDVGLNGEAYFTGSSVTSMQQSSLLQCAGQCTGDSGTSINFLNSDLFVSGQFNLDGSAAVSISSSVSTVSGTYSADGTSRTILTSGTFSVGFDDGVICDAGTATFDGSSSCELDANSEFNIECGDLTVTGTASLDMAAGSSLNVYNGNVFFMGSIELFLDGVTLNIEGLISIEEQAKVHIWNSDISVKGTFRTQDDILLDLDGATFTLFNSGLVTFDGTVNSAHTIYDSIFQLSGDIVFTGDVTPIFSGTSLSVQGELRTETRAAVQFISGSVVEVNQGDANFIGDSSLEFNQSSFTMNAGDVNFQDNVDVTFTDSVFDVIGSGPVVVIFDVDTDSDILFDNTSFNVLAGDVTFQSDSDPEFEDGTVSIAGGTVTFLDTAHPSFTSLLFTLSDGTLHFDEDSITDFVSTTLNISGGEFIGSGNSQVYFSDSEVEFLFGSTGEFDAHDDGKVYFESSSMTMNAGDVTFWDDSNLIFSDADVNLTINDGNFIFHNSSTLSTVPGNAIDVNGGNFNLFESSKVYGNGVTVTIDGSILVSDSAMAQFTTSTVQVSSGILRLESDSQTLFQTSSNIVINSGNLQTAGSAILTLDSSALEINASGGAIRSEDSSSVIAGGSTLTINNGAVIFTDQSSLTFLDAQTLLTINSGDFSFLGTSQFYTAVGTIVTINGGNFQTFDTVDIDFTQVTFNIYGGNFLQHESSSMSFVGNSAINVFGGNVGLMDSSTLDLDNSFITVNGGSFNTYDDITLTVTGSDISVYSGDVHFRGTQLSSVSISTTQVTVAGGNLIGSETSSVDFVDSNIDIVSGYFRLLDNTSVDFETTTLFLDVIGNIAMTGDAYWSVRESSGISVIAGGVTADFSGNALVDVYTQSEVRITDGDVVFRQNACLYLNPDTIFNLLGGSYVMRNNACFRALQNTTGTIIGGDMQVTDDASVLFVESDITIVGALNSNSTVPIVVSNGTTIVVNGAPVTLCGTASIDMGSSSLMTVLDGSLILCQQAKINSNDGDIRIFGGSIIGLDNSEFNNWNDATTVVSGGNIEMEDNSKLQIWDGAIVRVTTTPTTVGSIKLKDSSDTILYDHATISVDGGNIDLVGFATLSNGDDSLVQVITGDITLSDFTSYTGLPTSTLEVLSGGNFHACGVGVLISFTSSESYVQGGDFILCLRTQLESDDSYFEISANGNVLATDLSKSVFENGSQIAVFGGGNFQVLREAEVNMKNSSSLTVDGGGSILFEEDAFLLMENFSSMTVKNGGNIELHDNAFLKATNNCDSSVHGGGNIVYTNTTSVTLQSSSSMSVYDTGSMLFHDKTKINIDSNGFLLVSGTGSISTYDNTELNVSSASLMAEDGGSITLNGESISSFTNSASITVSGGGDVEFHQECHFSFDDSSLLIDGGNLETYDDTTSEFTNGSQASITGGSFLMRNRSSVDINGGTDFNIAAGNVELYDNGILDVSQQSSISVTGGSFLLWNEVEAEITQSSISVSGGNFAVTNEVDISLNLGQLEVSNGSALFSGSIEFQATTSTIEVSGGNLEIFADSTWISDSSSTSVSGGNIRVYGSAVTELNSSSYTVSDGDIEIAEESLFTLNQSVMDVSGGGILYDDMSEFTANESSITVTGGSITHDGTSVVNVHDTMISVNGASIPSREALITSASADLIIIKGSSTFTADTTTEISVVSGNFLFDESSSSTILFSTIDVSGGSVRHQGNTVVVFNNDEVTVSSGSFEVLDSSSINISECTIEITGGNWLIANAAQFYMITTLFHINQGSAVFTGGDVHVELSTVTVEGSGMIQFANSTLVTVLQSTMTLDGSGSLEFIENSVVSIIESSTNIVSGSFITDGNAQVLFQSSTFSSMGGDSTFGGSSVVQVENSHFEVTGGNVLFTDSAVVTIFDGSLYEVTGGSVTTDGAAQLILSDGSCVSVSQGNVFYQGSSIVQLNSACWTVNGGVVSFHDSASFSLAANSLLKITSGGFNSDGNSAISINQSTAVLEGGSITIGGSSDVTVIQSTIQVDDGNASWIGSSTSDIQDSQFIITGGNTLFAENSQVSWDSCTLTVSVGHLITDDSCVVSLSNSDIYVSSGSVFMKGSSTVDIDNDSFSLVGGSFNFQGRAQVSIDNTEISISGGNLYFADETEVSIANTGVLILLGSMGFEGSTEVLFSESQISISGGSVTASDQSNLHIIDTDLEIAGGSFIVQHQADILIERCDLEIYGGDYKNFDSGAVSVFESTVDIASGNFVASNPGSVRKAVAFVNSEVNVRRDPQDSSRPQGSMEIIGNVDLTMMTSQFSIDGDLQMWGGSKLHLVQQSVFNIPTGTVIMDEFSEINIQEGSTMNNQGTVFAPGTISVPSDSGLRNQGLMSVDHNLDVNCYNDVVNSSPLINSGTLSFGASVSGVSQSCIDNLEHRGLMQISGANVTLATLETYSSSTITLSSSTITMTTQALQSQGSLGGKGVIEGAFNNFNGASIMATSDSGTTQLDISREFRTAGAVYFMVNNLDFSQPDAFSVINADNVSFDGGRACICFSPTLKFNDGDKWDLVNAQTVLAGRFDSVEYDCTECPIRSARSVESTENSCSPDAQYSGTNFSILFTACGDGDNVFETISPPWYVIFPVAVGIIIILVIVLGGALFIEERYRKRKFQKRMASKRSARMKEMTGKKTATGSYSSGASDSSATASAGVY